MLPAVSTIELPAETPRASFPPVHGGSRDTNAVIQKELQHTVACPVRLVVALSEQVTVGAAGFPHRTVWCSHRTVRWSSLRVPPGTSHWAEVPWCTGQSGVWAPDSPVLHAQTVRRQHTSSFLDFSWIFLMSSFEVLLSSIP
jgi:hypothetical protein